MIFLFFIVLSIFAEKEFPLIQKDPLPINAEKDLTKQFISNKEFLNIKLKGEKYLIFKNIDPKDGNEGSSASYSVSKIYDDENLMLLNHSGYESRHYLLVNLKSGDYVHLTYSEPFFYNSKSQFVSLDHDSSDIRFYHELKIYKIQEDKFVLVKHFDTNPIWVTLANTLIDCDKVVEINYTHQYVENNKSKWINENTFMALFEVAYKHKDSDEKFPSKLKEFEVQFKKDKGEWNSVLPDGDYCKDL